MTSYVKEFEIFLFFVFFTQCEIDKIMKQVEIGS